MCQISTTMGRSNASYVSFRVGAHVWALSGHAPSTAALRMRASRKVPLTVGGVDCRLLQYSVMSKEEVLARGTDSERRARKREAAAWATWRAALDRLSVVRETLRGFVTRHEPRRLTARPP